MIGRELTLVLHQPITLNILLHRKIYNISDISFVAVSINIYIYIFVYRRSVIIYVTRIDGFFVEENNARRNSNLGKHLNPFARPFNGESQWLVVTQILFQSGRALLQEFSEGK